MEAINNRIRALRLERGYTQEYMADKIGISQNSYNKLESGKTKISIDRLKQLADIFSISEQSLMEGRESSLKATKEEEGWKEKLEQKVEELNNKLQEIDQMWKVLEFLVDSIDDYRFFMLLDKVNIHSDNNLDYLDKQALLIKGLKDNEVVKILLNKKLLKERELKAIVDSYNYDSLRRSQGISNPFESEDKKAFDRKRSKEWMKKYKEKEDDRLEE